MNHCIPIVRPRFPALSDMAEKIGVALKSGQVTNNGINVREFEEELTNYLGVETIVFCNGQSALMAMLATANIEGGSVICPSLTFCATPHAITWTGARPVFADINPKTLTIDPIDVERKITSETRAILAADPYGICADYDALAEIGESYNLPVFVDSAASFGSVYKGRSNAGVTDANMYSFHATKGFACIEGGAVCSHNPELIELAKKYRNFGQENSGDCAVAGINGKLQEINAIIGLEQLKTWPLNLTSRKIAASILAQKLSAAIPGILAAELQDQDPCWLYYPIRIGEDWPISRDEVIVALVERGIFSRRYYTPCHELTVYKALSSSLPLTERAGRELIALPVLNDMSRDEIDCIVTALVEIRQTKRKAA